MRAELMDNELFLTAAWEGLFDGTNPNADTDDPEDRRTASRAVIFMRLNIMLITFWVMGDCYLSISL